MRKDCPPIIVGAGPAGLYAAQILAEHGYPAIIFDAMPSPARKFLRAGIGGLNLSHSEAKEQFIKRYGSNADRFHPWIDQFGADQMVAWADSLGITCFTGSSGRIFPKQMKASPLLRAWLHRLQDLGCEMRLRHRWVGWDQHGGLSFETPEGRITQSSHTVILALGGASWPQLGSDGRWTTLFPDQCRPFLPSNCGFQCEWTAFIRQNWAGQPLKSVAISFGSQRRKGDCVISEYGLEGGLIYALSSVLRDEILEHGQAVLHMDLKPDSDESTLAAALSRPQGSRSFSSYLQRSINLKGAAAAIARDCIKDITTLSPTALAKAIKSVPITLTSARPVSEAISSAGGLCFSALDQSLMLRHRPGTFAIGEMLDWEAPTGGYLLTGCFAMARVAAIAAVQRLQAAQ